MWEIPNKPVQLTHEMQYKAKKYMSERHRSFLFTVNTMVEEKQPNLTNGLLSPFSWDERDVRVDDFPLMGSPFLPFG